jgi:hypothetical protein
MSAPHRHHPTSRTGRSLVSPNFRLVLRSRWSLEGSISPPIERQVSRQACAGPAWRRHRLGQQLCDTTRARRYTVHVPPELYRLFKILTAERGATSASMMFEALDLILEFYYNPEGLRRRLGSRQTTDHGRMTDEDAQNNKA